MIKCAVYIFMREQSESARLSEILDEIGTENQIDFIFSFFQDAKGLEDLSRNGDVGVIFADMELAKENGFELNIRFRNYPVITIVEKDIDFRILEESMLKGSSGFVERPLEKNGFSNTLKPVLKKLRYVDSYSNSIINAHLEFFSTEDIANRMTSIAKIACSRFKIDEKSSADIFRVLKILSIAIKTNSFIKTMRLFDQLRVAKKLIEILNNSAAPKDTIASIVHMIYFFELMRYKNKNFEEYKSELCDPEIYRDILLMFNKKEILIESGMDLENIWTELLESVNSNSIPIEEADEFISSSIKITKRILVYHQGGVVRILKYDNHIEFQIQPIIFNEILRGWVENLSKDLSHSSGGFSLSVFIEKEMVVVKLSSPEMRVVEAPKEDLFLDMDSILGEETPSIQLHFTDGDKRIKVTATEFLYQIEDIEEIDVYMEVLKLLEDEIEEILTKDPTLSAEALHSASEIFAKYGSFLGSLDEFRELSYAVYTLSSVLRSCKIEELEKNEKKIYRFLVSVLDDLAAWKRCIFIDRSAIDIHYLDDSLLSSCAQLESLINQTSQKEEAVVDSSDDLELF